ALPACRPARRMGASLPSPVTSTVVERQKSERFDVAVAEMNGWRTSMEDAHLILLRPSYGVFGVFDGHGGGACSEFAAKRLKEEIEKTGRPSDEEIKKMFFKIDQEFLDSEQASGSTATMCVVEAPSTAGGKHRLLVINAGDSRVLLGRRDGSIVDGKGTDQGLTTDHKPNHPPERERIERCGGKVEITEGGVARVNGNLAVSRGFGDKDEKTTGGPGPENRPVTVEPELGHFECDDSDFVLLVCDGVSEGNFPNAEVVKLVASMLRDGKDMGEAVKAVCHKAVETDSKDNITCMGVLLGARGGGGSDSSAPSVEFHPGPLTHLGKKGFRAAYAAMAEKAGLSLAEAVLKRYEVLQQELKAISAAVLGQQDAFHDEARDGKLQMTAKDRYRYWEKTYGDPRAKAGKDWYGPWKEFQKDVAGPAFSKTDDILVVGCGNSFMVADLARQGFRHVVGMDYSKKAIQLQQQRFPELRWVRADARRMPAFADGSFDVVIEKA
ncbi:unnamed protein product, partial [Durusdinium trenchii]